MLQRDGYYPAEHSFFAFALATGINRNGRSIGRHPEVGVHATGGPRPVYDTNAVG